MQCPADVENNVDAVDNIEDENPSSSQSQTNADSRLASGNSCDNENRASLHQIKDNEQFERSLDDQHLHEESTTEMIEILFEAASHDLVLAYHEDSNSLSSVLEFEEQAKKFRDTRSFESSDESFEILLLHEEIEKNFQDVNQTPELLQKCRKLSEKHKPIPMSTTLFFQEVSALDVAASITQTLDSVDRKTEKDDKRSNVEECVEGCTYLNFSPA